MGVWNWQRFSNEEFDRLNQEASTELDMEKRGAMYFRMQELMEESGDFVFLTFEPIGTLTAAGVMPAMRPDGWPILSRFTKA
ncbi:hypothetical protein [Gemmobacter sp. 24YEA27]|uniref:hypothetical protein n=1 Tax=Gemmobacter sp. 24YEA27 TaxID=3040672 RepID=UPI0024B38CE5|nr:hypothetical protein [Gemmobacter sp. 24YEA27]